MDSKILIITWRWYKSSKYLLENYLQSFEFWDPFCSMSAGSACVMPARSCRPSCTHAHAMRDVLCEMATLPSGATPTLMGVILKEWSRAYVYTHARIEYESIVKFHFIVISISSLSVDFVLKLRDVIMRNKKDAICCNCIFQVWMILSMNFFHPVQFYRSNSTESVDDARGRTCRWWFIHSQTYSLNHPPTNPLTRSPDH